MFPAKFAYAAPRSLGEAVSLLEQGNGDAKLLAGGHSLLPLMKLRLAQPSLLVDLARIPSLAYVRADGPEIAVGALSTYRDLERSDVLNHALPVVSETARDVGDVQVRARGTLAGSLAHADPAGDMPAVVLALGVRLVVVGPSGERTIDIDEFFVDMLTTTLGESDIIREVRIQRLGERTGATYQKFDQPASHYALTGVCAVVTVGEGANQTIASARLGVTGVGPKAYRPREVERALVGCALESGAVDTAVRGITDGIDVQGDIHASVGYRAHLARVLARRAVLRAGELAAKQ